ncbi:MAG: hypothetical protein J0H56_08890 [Micrococcales bacterium]|nr:hypothetical protein [Micrococcales bacterium]
MPASTARTLEERIAAWTWEIQRAFARHPKPGASETPAIPPISLAGVGTPALKRLFADLVGSKSVEDDQFGAFLLTAATTEDSRLAGPDQRRRQRALAIGACAWLFVPRAQREGFRLIFFHPDGRPKGNLPRHIDVIATRQAWAYIHYLTAWHDPEFVPSLVSDAKALPFRGSPKSGDNHRELFRDALIAAVTAYIEKIDAGADVLGHEPTRDLSPRAVLESCKVAEDPADRLGQAIKGLSVSTSADVRNLIWALQEAEPILVTHRMAAELAQRIPRRESGRAVRAHYTHYAAGRTTSTDRALWALSNGMMFLHRVAARSDGRQVLRVVGVTEPSDFETPFPNDLADLLRAGTAIDHAVEPTVMVDTLLGLQLEEELHKGIIETWPLYLVSHMDVQALGIPRLSWPTFTSAEELLDQVGVLLDNLIPGFSEELVDVDDSRARAMKAEGDLFNFRVAFDNWSGAIKLAESTREHLETWTESPLRVWERRLRDRAASVAQ